MVRLTGNDIATYLGRLADGHDVSAELQGRSLVEVTRLACDDLRTWYLPTARRQPGHATTAELDSWFWCRTALARLIGQVAGRLLSNPEPIVRGLASRALVPRAYERLLVPGTA